jgi:hypothetical protein
MLFWDQLIVANQILSGMQIFYELVGKVKTDWDPWNTNLHVLSNQQFKALTGQESQPVLEFKNIIIENVPFKSYTFHSTSLCQLFCLKCTLSFIDM